MSSDNDSKRARFVVFVIADGRDWSRYCDFVNFSWERRVERLRVRCFRDNEVVRIVETMEMKVEIGRGVWRVSVRERETRLGKVGVRESMKVGREAISFRGPV